MREAINTLDNELYYEVAISGREEYNFSSM